MHTTKINANPLQQTVNSIEATVKSALMLEILSVALTDPLYNAALAGLYFKFGLNHRGLMLEFRGFSEKTLLLVEAVLDFLKAFEYSDHATSVGLARETMQRIYDNRSNTIGVFARELVKKALHPDSSTSLEKAQVLRDMGTDVKKPDLGHSSVQVLCHGNIKVDREQHRVGAIVNKFQVWCWLVDDCVFVLW